LIDLQSEMISAHIWNKNCASPFNCLAAL